MFVLHLHYSNKHTEIIIFFVYIVAYISIAMNVIFS